MSEITNEIVSKHGEINGASVRYEYDIAGLRILGSDLLSIKNQLLEQNAVIERYLDAMGSQMIVEQLTGFAHNWSKRKQTLVLMVENAANLVSEAASEYEAQESGFVHALS